MYTSIRVGLYYNLTDSIKRNNNGVVTFPQMVATSLFAGGVGSIIGNPMDVALVRMQADKRMPEEERRNYTNVFNALLRIVREEGWLACWSGVSPTVVRAICLNVSMLATFDYAKKWLA